jgi:hypothetical protein
VCVCVCVWRGGGHLRSIDSSVASDESAGARAAAPPSPRSFPLPPEREKHGWGEGEVMRETGGGVLEGLEPADTEPAKHSAAKGALNRSRGKSSR